jgi:hypothetical protein
MGEGRTAVILQRTEPGIRVDPIASDRQVTAAIVAAQIIAKQGYGAELLNIINVLAHRTCFEVRVSNLHRSALIEDAAAVGVERGAAKVAAKVLLAIVSVAPDQLWIAPPE